MHGHQQLHHRLAWHASGQPTCSRVLLIRVLDCTTPAVGTTECPHHLPLSENGGTSRESVRVSQFTRMHFLPKNPSKSRRYIWLLLEKFKLKLNLLIYFYLLLDSISMEFPSLTERLITHSHVKSCFVFFSSIILSFGLCNDFWSIILINDTCELLP